MEVLRAKIDKTCMQIKPKISNQNNEILKKYVEYTIKYITISKKKICITLIYKWYNYN